MSSNNPFDFSKAFANNSFDFTKSFEQFNPMQVAEKIQSAFKTDAFNLDAFNDIFKGKFDFSAIQASQEKNLKLLMSTNQAFADSSKEIFMLQAEMLKQAMIEATKATQTLASSGSPQEAVSKQAELIQQAYEKALANSTDINQMAQKAQEEISEKVSKRLEESMEEFKKTLSNIS